MTVSLSPDAKTISQTLDVVRGVIVIKTTDSNGTVTTEVPMSLAQINLYDLKAKGQAALTANATFLTQSTGVTAPLTNTQMNILVAHIRALTKQLNVLIKIELDDLENVTNT